MWCVVFSSGLNKTFLIVNPAAGRGRIHAKLAQMSEFFSAQRRATIYHTTARGDEASLTQRAIHEGATTIVAAGGDGTCGRIAEAIVGSGTTCRLTVIPTGTGNDFAKTLGIDRYSPEQVADLVDRGRETRIDVGLAAGHYFLNSCGFGFDASVLEASNSVRLLKGNAVYIYAALKQLFTYDGIEVAAGGVPGVKRGSMLMVTISNGQYLGGAFKIAPRASVLDGKLDVCFFGDSGVINRVKLFAGAMRGTHIGMPAVTSAASEQLTLTFPSNPSMEMDGELRVAQSRTIEIRCIPRALAVIAAPGALS
jgi:diacylglycerol kinase (ATP)